MSLQVRYRPASFKNFAGNETVVESLKEVLDREDIPSSFLIIGPSGCGKTTLGRIISKYLGCHKDDFLELNTANDRGIGAIRKILDDMNYAPMSGKKKVILLDEAHQITGPAQESLLKAIEEPPAHVHFIICTTNPEALKDTFKRRCHIYEVSLLSSAEIITHLQKIIKAEKVENYPIQILDKIAELSGGSCGIALKYLDMVIDMKDEVDRALDTLKSSGAGESEVIEICRVLVNFKVPSQTRWLKCKDILNSLRVDPESARRPILAYFHKCLMGKNSNESLNYQYAMLMDEFKDNFYDSGFPGLSLACFKSCYLDSE